MKKLYITDLDGTFLNGQIQISDKSAEIINSLPEGEVYFTVATARTYATTGELFQKTHLTAPAVMMNGVMIYDFNEKRVVKTHAMTAEQGKKILEIYAKHNLFPLTYFLSEDDHIDIYYQELKNDEIKAYVHYRNKSGIKRFHKISGEPSFDGGKLLYMTGMDDESLLREICEEIKQIDGVGYTFCKDNYSDCYFLETFSAYATKGIGAVDVKNLVGAEGIVAFGDNLNDISLFEKADECYAVSNASPELKKISTGVIGSNDEDAVAKFIYKDFYGKDYD